ncbi:MAG: hypothetical protein ACP5UO_01610 [Thermoplasmata archaeon]
MTYGSQQFFDELKERLNKDERFRSLGKDAYTATELIYIKDLRVGIWQNTADGEISELKLIPRREIDQYLQRAELVYYVEDYDSMVKISLGEESFVSLVIQDAIVFKGPMKKLSKIQAPSERMETLLREMTKNVVVPSRIQYQKWLHENGYL